MSFLDASVLLAVEDPDDVNCEAARALLRSAEPRTLDLAVYEVSNTTDLKWRNPKAGRRLRSVIWEIDGAMGLERVDGALIERAVQIAAEQGITAYDAAYVAAAERAGVPLVSCDVRDLVSKGLAATPSAMLDRLRAEEDEAEQ